MEYGRISPELAEVLKNNIASPTFGLKVREDEPFRLYTGITDIDNVFIDGDHGVDIDTRFVIRKGECYQSQSLKAIESRKQLRSIHPQVLYKILCGILVAKGLKFEPKDGDNFYYIRGNGEVRGIKKQLQRGNYPEKTIAYGNYFPTIDSAGKCLHALEQVFRYHKGENVVGRDILRCESDHDVARWLTSVLVASSLLIPSKDMVDKDYITQVIESYLSMPAEKLDRGF